METLLKPIKFGIGIDIGKDEFHACVSAIDQNQRIKIKVTHAFENTLKGFAECYKWADHHAKQGGPVSDGSHRRLLRAVSLVSPSAPRLCLCVVLPQKAKYYIKALGIKTKTDGVDAQALATMVCQQCLEGWKPISETMYKLRQLTRQ